MSRLNDLLYQLRAKEPELAKDLEREVTALAERRAFGLNFERHVPEAVELPGRKVRKGDKVRILPPRGEMATKADDSLWRVLAVDRTSVTASLELLERLADGESTINATNAAVDDLVVVAEFRDSIYPGLESTGKVVRGGDKPFHTVINAENFHALETLLFTHRGKVDAIYIDPPYNTGARDWKYNNDYVETEDLYRHSKWLAMMERRLLLAKELLNPLDSVLIVTIDERECSHLGVLLEQMFPQVDIQLVTVVTNHAGSIRRGRFTRVEEYMYVVFIGESQVCLWQNNMLTKASEEIADPTVWFAAIRTGGRAALRANRSSPVLFYPVFVDSMTGRFHSVGEPVPREIDRHSVKAPPGTDVVWPLAGGGAEQTWQVSGERMTELFERGYARINRRGGFYSITYMRTGTIEKIEEGTYEVVGRADDGGVQLNFGTAQINRFAPTAVWYQQGHFARDYGTHLLGRFVPGRPFPFPKSLYTVEDSLRFFTLNKPEAVIVDFFTGSGTTAHAVMRLNKQDGGRRQSISVTNNEVAADEQKALREAGLRPGDTEWEQWGICEYITKPRIEAAITGQTPEGEPVKGDYKFTDEFPMADGFEENVEFFTLTYEAPLRVASHREFVKVAPLLWMRAGCRGRRIDDVSKGWDVADVYGVLADLDKTEDFLKKIAAAGDDMAVAFIVTDEDRLFESVARELPEHVEPVRLYEAYLRNFEIESGRGAL